ncbi:MAG TPA: flagellar hook-length control protein FliK [Leptolinea sp.]
MKESVLSVGGIAPPKTSPKPIAHKASAAKTGPQFGAILREEVKSKPSPDVEPVKEDSKVDKSPKSSPENATQPTKEDVNVNAILSNPAAVAVQQNPTPNSKDADKSGSENTLAGSQSVLPEVAKVDAGNGDAITLNQDLASNVVTAAKEALTPKSQDAAAKEALTAKSQDTTVKAATTSDPQASTDQSAKVQGQIQFADTLEKANTDFQVAGEPHQSPKPAAASLTPAAAANPGPSSDRSGQLASQTFQKSAEDTSTQAASAANNGVQNSKKDSQGVAVKPENATAVSSGLEKTGMTEGSKNIEPARLAEARAPEFMNQILNGLETLVKSKNAMMRMQLYPDELGHIELKVVTNAQGMEVYLRADQPMTQQLLESQLALLRQSLSSVGLNPTQIDVGQGNTNRSFNTRDPKRSAQKILKDASRSGSGTINAIEIPILGRNSAENGLDYKI